MEGVTRTVVTSADGTPYLRAGLLTGVAATLLGVLTAAVVTLVATAGEPGVPAMLRTAARAWIVPLGSGLEVDGTPISLVPLGGTLVVALVVAVTARRVLREPVDEPGPYAATVAGTTGILAGVLSAASSSAGVSTSAPRAAFGAFVVAGVTAALVARRGSEDRESRLGEHHEVLAVLRAATTGAGALLAACAVMVLVLLAASLDRAAELWAALDPGASGGIALGALSVVAVPTLVLWAAAVVLGPGVQLGTDTSLDLTGAYLGPVPGLPVLAALPDPGAFPDVVVVLGALPLLAGVLAGWRLAVPEETALVRRVGLGSAAGGAAGLAVGALALLSAGSVGPGRMADVGPTGPTVLLVAVLVLAAGGAVGATLAHYRGVRAQQPSDPEGRGPRLRLGNQSAGADRRGGADRSGADRPGSDDSGLRTRLRRLRRGRGSRP